MLSQQDMLEAERHGKQVRSIYVYEAPVRLWHWVMMVAMLFLAATGYLIGSPPPAIGGEATHSYFFGYIRMIHFIAGMIFAVAFLVRIYWALVGNHSSRAIGLPILASSRATPQAETRRMLPIRSSRRISIEL